MRASRPEQVRDGLVITPTNAFECDRQLTDTRTAQPLLKARYFR